jgi:hypothetical protein
MRFVSQRFEYWAFCPWSYDHQACPERPSQITQRRGTISHTNGDTNFKAWFTLLVRTRSADSQLKVSSSQLTVRSRSAHSQVTVSSQSAQGQLTVSSQSAEGQLTVRSRSAQVHLNTFFAVFKCTCSYQRSRSHQKTLMWTASHIITVTGHGIHKPGKSRYGPQAEIVYSYITTFLLRMLNTVSWQSYVIYSAPTVYLHKINLMQSSGWWSYIYCFSDCIYEYWKRRTEILAIPRGTQCTK